jgi:CheY-like chemotaxis protein
VHASEASWCATRAGRLERISGVLWRIQSVRTLQLPRDQRDIAAGPQGDDGLEVPVLVVDDQAVFRDVMSEVVRATPGMRLVGEAASGEEAIAAVQAHSPRLVVMDKRMPGIGGIEAARAIGQRFPAVVLVLVSVEQPAAEVLEASGAAAFLPKRAISPRVLAEIWATYGA